MTFRDLVEGPPLQVYLTGKRVTAVRQMQRGDYIFYWRRGYEETFIDPNWGRCWWLGIVRNIRGRVRDIDILDTNFPRWFLPGTIHELGFVAAKDRYPGDTYYNLGKDDPRLVRPFKPSLSIK